jgi:transcriptional regulator with XRE-family HTH domain
MPMTSLTGSRVRERRLQAGLRQADLARSAGISPAYLNLIEHNRRRIGGDVLDRLAVALGVETATLEEGHEDGLVADLRAVAAMSGAGPAATDAAAELDRIDELISRFPGWAGLLAQSHRRTSQLERALAALNDRLAHDPHLSLALHELLSAISAVRSTAAILAETEDIDPEWRARFHRNLRGDSERLAAGAEALVGYLDRDGGGDDAQIATPQEELDAWLESRGWHLPEAETGDSNAADVAISELASAAARDLARDWVAQATRDAALLPIDAFSKALMRLGPDPARLAETFGVPLQPVFRRLATLPGSRNGLVICDAAGALVFRKPAEGFAPPRFGAACPLWPLYLALARPMTPIDATVELAGRAGRRFLMRAFCQPSFPAGFSGPEVREALMLILPETGPEPATGPRLRVGVTCRICPAAGCPARREPSILTETDMASEQLPF